MTTPAGWYDDGRGQQRFWDGNGWTEQTVTAGPPPQWAPTPRKRKSIFRRVWFWLLALVAVIIVIVVVAVGVAVNKGVNNPHTVIYSITGNGQAADITYATFNGNGTSGEQQDSGAALPWSKTVTGKGDFSDFTLSAQGSINGGGTSISCSITVDGKVKATQTSTGQYSVVSCNTDASTP